MGDRGRISPLVSVDRFRFKRDWAEKPQRIERRESGGRD